MVISEKLAKCIFQIFFNIMLCALVDTSNWTQRTYGYANKQKDNRRFVDFLGFCKYLFLIGFSIPFFVQFEVSSKTQNMLKIIKIGSANFAKICSPIWIRGVSQKHRLKWRIYIYLPLIEDTYDSDFQPQLWIAFIR